MKSCGIVMAGGSGNRLKPATDIINKHLLPIYNKPMIFYALSVLIYAKIKNILIICNKEDEFKFKTLLKPVQKKIKYQYSIKYKKIRVVELLKD